MLPSSRSCVQTVFLNFCLAIHSYWEPRGRVSTETVGLVATSPPEVFEAMSLGAFVAPAFSW